MLMAILPSDEVTGPTAGLDNQICLELFRALFVCSSLYSRQLQLFCALLGFAKGRFCAGATRRLGSVLN
jgi:hypothetical protein